MSAKKKLLDETHRGVEISAIKNGPGYVACYRIHGKGHITNRRDYAREAIELAMREIDELIAAGPKRLQPSTEAVTTNG